MLWFSQRPPCVLRTVIVNLKNDREAAIRGILWETRGPWFTVTEAQLLTSGAAPAPLDGSAVVHRDNVAFLQVLP